MKWWGQRETMESKRALAVPALAILASAAFAAPTPVLVTAPAGPIHVGTIPTGVATGDFNGDGKFDIAVANYGDNTVTILLGDGAGGFTVTGSPIAVGTGPIAIVMSDFNRDNKNDLAVVNKLSNNVTILLGNGSGGFAAAPSSPIAVGGTPLFAVATDFNNDNKPDLAVTNWNSSTVTVLLGNGSGGFSASAGSPFSTGPNPAGIVALDLDKNGKMDLAIADQGDNKVTTLLGDGAGGFTAGISNAGGASNTLLVANIYGMTSGDFYTHGTTDVITASSGISEVSILKGDGFGDLIYNNQFTAVNHPVTVAAGDFDGDGKLDVAVVCEGSSQLLILIGDGAGNFNANTAPFFSTGSNPYGIATADFNNDGRPDIVVTNQNANTISIFLTTGPPLPTVPSAPPAVPTPPFQPPASPQTISFTVSDHLASDAPFTLQATASSGLPVTFTVLSGPATLNGNTLTLTGIGNITVEAAQAGNSQYLPAVLDQTFHALLGAPSIKSVVNGASFTGGAGAANFYATVFGSSFVQGAYKGDLSSSQKLGGTTVTIFDSAKNTVTANLGLVTFGQINFVMPPGVAPGPATITVGNTSGKTASTPITIAAVAPGLFSSDGTGAGDAAGEAVIVNSDGTQTVLATSACSPFNCTLAAIPVSAGTPVYLTLFGTGLRGRSGLAGVALTLGNTPATVTYAGPQGTYDGLDQVDALIPASLAGAGIIDVKLTVDGSPANTLKIKIQ